MFLLVILIQIDLSINGAYKITYREALAMFPLTSNEARWDGSVE